MFSWLWSDPLPTGAPAPDFTALDDAGRTVTLNALRGPGVFFGFIPAAPVYSGLAPGFSGLYQVNAAIPAGVTGTVPLLLSIGKSVSNSVQVTIP